MPSCAIGGSGESPKSGSARDTDRHSHARVCTHFTCLKSALVILNMVILPPITLPSAASGVIMRLLLSFFALMYVHTALTMAGVAIFALPVIVASAGLSVRTLKIPLPAASCLAATEALLLCWPFLRLPPTYFTFFFFAFLRFFFFLGFFAFFFFFFFLTFFFFGFFAFFFLAGFFLAGFFFADFFLAAVCCVRATVVFWICLVTSATTMASSGSMSAH